MAAVGSGNMRFRPFCNRDHPLLLEHIPDEFHCGGCNERGYGYRYLCEQCKFHLHESCGQAPESIKQIFHHEHRLDFGRNPINSPQSKCCICGERVRGLSYGCRQCSMDFHISCVYLPPLMQHPWNPEHVLQLLPTPQPIPRCNLCYKMFADRPEMYQSVDRDFNLHISCAKLPVDWLEHFRLQQQARPA